AEATLRVEKMKSEALEVAREQGQQESEILLKNSSEEADRILDFARLQSQELQERVQKDTETVARLSAEISDREDSLKALQGEVQALLNQKKECEVYISEENQLLEKRREDEVQKLKNLFQDENDRLKTLYQAEEKKWTELV